MIVLVMAALFGQNKFLAIQQQTKTGIKYSIKMWAG